MANISSFDGLSNELIICVFDYLQPAESYKSFFDCNDRLRKLVKRYVTFSHRALNDDIVRFSSLHSWYKHLNYNDGGIVFYMIPLKSQQPRYHFDPCIPNRQGIHWHFSQEMIKELVDKRIEEISGKYPIKLNPSIHPEGDKNSKMLFQNGPDFIRQYYPTQHESLATTLFHKSYTTMLEILPFYTDDVASLLTIIYENEEKRLRYNIQETARCIWKDIQALEDVNILKIE